MIKKYVFLFAFTSISIAAILLAAPMFSPDITAVSLHEVQSGMFDQTVTCSGKIEAADSKNVSVEYPCVVDNVNVTSGQAVKKGDILFSIDIAATKEVLASAGGISSELISDNQITPEVKSPVDGVVSSVSASAGDALAVGQTCAVISSSEHLQVKVSIHENKLRDISVGQNVTVSGSAFLKNNYSGIVTSIASSARQQFVGTNTETVVDTIITLSESDASLKPGLTAKAKIQIGNASECIVIPYDYVMQDDLNQEYVYVYQKGRAVKRLIETGKELSDGFEILSGLEIGDHVIANPYDVPKADARVSYTLQTAKGEGANA